MEIVIPFVKVKAINPNMSKFKSLDQSDEYYKCIVVSFMSFRKFNPDINLVLATNISPPTTYLSWLDKLGVKIRKIPFTYEPPFEFGDKFKGCFYIFDAINVATDDALYIDPDFLCIKDLKNLSRELDTKVGIFELDFPKDYKINGMTVNEAAEIWSIFKPWATTPPNNLSHFGGEAIYIPLEKLAEVNSDIDKVWNWNKHQAKSGQKLLTTEEHIFTNLLKSTDLVLLNNYISRVWTARSFSENQGSKKPVTELSMWHLPSEKNRGFKVMYETLNSSNNLLEMDNEKFISMCLEIFHIDSRLYKFIYKLRKWFIRIVTIKFNN